jgi:ABC-type multidrug transport system fused ATPase/permease subunit
LRRYLSLWGDLFTIAWRRAPGSVVVALGASLLGVVASAGAVLALRAVVDGSVHGTLRTALAGAVGAALCYGATSAVQGVIWDGTMLLADKTDIELRPRIQRWITTVEGLDHLERTDFLDRLETARTGTWLISISLWQMVNAVRSGLQLGVTLLILGSVSPWLLLLLPSAAVPVWSDHRGKKVLAAAEMKTAETFRLQRHLFRLASRAGSNKDIKVAGAEEEIAGRQAIHWQEMSRARYRARLRAACWRFGGWMVFAGGFIGGLAVVTHQAAHGHGTSGDVVMAIAIASGLRQTVQQAVGSTVSTIGARTAISSYLWLRDYTAADRARTAGTAPAPTGLRQGIGFEHVSYRYPGTDRVALDDVTVRIPAGTVVAIVGEYGSGKSTLAKLLVKFYRPDTGRVTVDGTDLARIDTADWRSRISAVFQDFGRLETTVAEGVGVGDLPHLTDREHITRAVRDADATALVEQLPKGLDTMLGSATGGTDLSEGQWQRIALARAAMREEPLVFLLDEPTASLDAPSEQAIFEQHMARARQLAERTGAITVIISHRFSTVTGADLILVLHQGRLVECGTHGELQARDGGRYAALYGIQARAYTR